MKQQKTVLDIPRADCIGCGLCSSVCGSSSIRMASDDIGFVPVLDEASCTGCGLCRRVCPGVNRLDYPGLLGQVESMELGHARDANRRKQASSGGLCRTILRALLERGAVDAVIVTRAGASPYEPETLVTSDVADLDGDRLNSIYSPTKPLDVLKRLDRNKRYVLVGLPCHIAGFSLARQYHKSIVLTIGLFCSHTPSFAFVRQLLADHADSGSVSGVRYRGEGWPGFSKILRNDGGVARIPFPALWKRYNQDKQYQQPRCASCSYYSAEFADISLGDPWLLAPFDHRGSSLVFIRSERGRQALDLARPLLNLRSIPRWQRRFILKFHEDSARNKQAKAAG